MSKVSIIVPAYLESNRHYLEACLRSIANLDYSHYNFDVVVVSPWATQEYVSDLLPRIVSRVIKNTRTNSFSGSINSGVAASNKDSQYILLLSDDTIITRNALTNLVTATGDGDAIMNAVSNCDNYLLYHLPLPHIYPHRYYALNDKSATTHLMNAESPFPAGMLFADSLCFYATFIPRHVWNRVGELDEAYNMGYEDTDYCMRAKAMGVPCMVALNAIIWHAGGGTGEVITDEMRVQNKKLFVERWGESAG